jgi:hypothetical protein
MEVTLSVRKSIDWELTSRALKSSEGVIDSRPRSCDRDRSFTFSDFPLESAECPELNNMKRRRKDKENTV